MKENRKQYEKVEKLTDGALSIANYALKHNITVSYVYRKFTDGKIKIVEFQGYNFVVDSAEVIEK